MDAVYLALMAGFGVGTWALLVLCDRLTGERR